MNSSEVLPDVLFHYTDAVGLMGIVSPSSWAVRNVDVEPTFVGASQLLASDVRYMNDSQELLFGAKIFVARLREAASDSKTDPLLAGRFAELATLFVDEDVFGWGLRGFAACFCRSGDLLSQWRGYAGGVGGYAIGFSFEALLLRSWSLHQRSVMTIPDSNRALLRKVSYGVGEAKAAADSFVESMERKWVDGTLPRDVDQRPALWWMSGIAFREIAAVKDAAFRDEDEWRLSAMTEVNDVVRLRARRSGLVPFLEFAVNMSESTGSPAQSAIARLVVGPGPDQSGQFAAAKELLRTTGHNPEVVVKSLVPFRG